MDPSETTQCSYCYEECHKVSNKRRHENQFHGKGSKPYECYLCFEDFDDDNRLSAHTVDRHQPDVEDLRRSEANYSVYLDRLQAHQQSTINEFFPRGLKIYDEYKVRNARRPLPANPMQVYMNDLFDDMDINAEDGNQSFRVWKDEGTSFDTRTSSAVMNSPSYDGDFSFWPDNDFINPFCSGSDEASSSTVPNDNAFINPFCTGSEKASCSTVPNDWVLHEIDSEDD